MQKRAMRTGNCRAGQLLISDPFDAIRRRVRNKYRSLTSMPLGTGKLPENFEHSRNTLVYHGIEDRREDFIRRGSDDCSVGCCKFGCSIPVCAILVDTRKQF